MHDREAITMPIIGTMHAGASEQEWLETALTPVSKSRAFGRLTGGLGTSEK